MLSSVFSSADENGVEGPSESNVYELVIKDLTVQDEGTFICGISGLHAISQSYILTVNSKCSIYWLKLLGVQNLSELRTSSQEKNIAGQQFTVRLENIRFRAWSLDL